MSVPDLTERLSEIRVPVLLIWATGDILTPLGVAHLLASKIPTTSLVTFDSDDHWVARQFADETARAIQRFVEQVSEGSDSDPNERGQMETG